MFGKKKNNLSLDNQVEEVKNEHEGKLYRCIDRDRKTVTFYLVHVVAPRVSKAERGEDCSSKYYPCTLFGKRALFKFNSDNKIEAFEYDWCDVALPKLITEWLNENTLYEDDPNKAFKQFNEIISRHIGKPYDVFEKIKEENDQWMRAIDNI